jgi:hypothetical protein
MSSADAAEEKRKDCHGKKKRQGKINGRDIP